MPKLIPSEGQIETINSVKTSARNSLITVIAGNMIMNLMMASSLQTMWIMINSLQVFTHFQGINIIFPPNIQLVLDMVRSVTEGDVLPQELVKKFYFWNYFD